MTSSVRFCTSSGGMSSWSGPKAISSKTVEEKSWMSGFWNRKPTFFRKNRAYSLSSRVSNTSSFTGMPNAENSPDVGYVSALRIESNVDLPLPLAPRMAVCSPAWNDRVTPLSASNRLRVRVGYVAQIEYRFHYMPLLSSLNPY